MGGGVISTMNTRHLRPSDLAGRRWRGLIRESTERQAENWSPERQRSDLRRAADELGLIPVEPLFYERVGSGEEEGASELAQALADGRRGEYDVLLVLHTSRFARNRAEAVRMKAEFRRAGIVIYFAAQRLISGTYTGSLTEGISEVIDEAENESRRMWIAGGLRQRQTAGRWVGGIPYGYQRALVDLPDGTRGWTGLLRPDPVSGPVVRDIFERAARGEGVRSITSALNIAGHRTQSGRPWSFGSVDAILRNPAYAGRLVRYRDRSAAHYYEHASDDGHVDLGQHLPALVDPALFDQLQEHRSRRFHGSRHDRRMRAYPLSGVLRCRRCGGRMTGYASGHGTRYYRCTSKARFRTCDAPGIASRDAEAAFAEWLSSHRLPDDWRTAIARTRVTRQGKVERDRRQVLEGRLAKLRELYEWGDIAKDDYLRRSAEIKADIGVIVLPSMPGIEAVAAALGELGKGWEAAPDELRATIPRLMLKAAEVECGRIVTFVVDATLRPLLDVCTPAQASLDNTRAVHPEVRYSA